ncbi:MAG: hypothetical protein KDD56_08910, partial [Bdellovibrionales bacterium]|nr:hypothetical protein [Bdellovibrionales bacterium]
MARDVTIEPISIDGKDPEISELRFSPLTPDKKKVEIVNSHKDTKDFKKLWQIARIFTKAKIGSDLSNACIEVLQAKGEFAEQAHNVLIDDYSKSYSGKQSDILKQEVIIKLLAGATSYAAQNFLFQTIALYDDGMTDIGRKHADLAGESLASTEVLLPYVQNGLLGLLDCGKPILLISQRP